MEAEATGSAYDKLSDPIALTVFVLTLLLPVVVGLLAMRRTKTQSDFLVGGRAMGRLVVALSAVSSGRSSWLVLGVSGMAYKIGVGAVWSIVGYTVVELLQFIYVGRRLREAAQTHDAMTLLDYFESRFPGDRRQLLRIVGGLIIVVFMTAYVAAQLNAGATALHTALRLPLGGALWISAALILVYMMLGGYVAVAYNDAVRATIMLLGLVVLPAYGLAEVGGLGALLGQLAAIAPSQVDPLALGAGAIIGFVGIGLGSPGQPHIVVRYMSIDDPDKLRSAALIGTFWNVVLGWGALFVGLVGRTLVPVTDNLPGANPEMVYLALSSRFFGPIFYGLLVGGIFAAILSTADSQLLVVSSTFSRDLYEKIICRDRGVDPGRQLTLSRVVLLAAGLLALGLAFVAQDVVFWLVLFAWGGLGAAFGTSLILSLFWRRTHRHGVLAGLLTGTALTIVWKLWLKESTGVYELIPAFAGSALAVVVVSLLCEADDEADDRRQSETTRP